MAEAVTNQVGDAVATLAKTAEVPAVPTEQKDESANAPVNKLLVVVKALKGIETSLQNVIRLIEDETGSVPAAITVDPAPVARLDGTGFDAMSGGRVIEGVFDGLQMIGGDGKTYAVPANYASKSKLVEGDLLKLTITPKGSFIYKQIGPIERGRVIGTLGFDLTSGDYFVTHENRRWSVIKASVTYFKGEPGDETVILVPKSAPSKWAAVENIIKKNLL